MENAGKQPTPPMTVDLYLSADEDLDPADLFLKQLKTKSLEPGEAKRKGVSKNLPRYTWPGGKLILLIATPIDKKGKTPGSFRATPLY